MLQGLGAEVLPRDFGGPWWLFAVDVEDITAGRQKAGFEQPGGQPGEGQDGSQRRQHADGPYGEY